MHSLSRRGRRSFFDLVAEFNNPKSRVDVVEINQTIVRLCAPHERQIWTVRIRIATPQSSDFPALAIEIITQLARDVDDASDRCNNKLP